jgi:hypothetical protein
VSDSLRDDQKKILLSNGLLSTEDSGKKVVLKKLGTSNTNKNNFKFLSNFKNSELSACTTKNNHTPYECSKDGESVKQKYFKAMNTFLDFKMKSAKVRSNFK